MQKIKTRNAKNGNDKLKSKRTKRRIIKDEKTNYKGRKDE